MIKMSDVTLMYSIQRSESMNINSRYYNYSSSLFTTNSQSLSQRDNFLGDYLSIKNGSYKKLLKAYYEKQEAEGNNTNGVLVNDSTAKAEYLTAKQDADLLMKEVSKLLEKGKDSLFHKKDLSTSDESTTNNTEVGESSSQYDMVGIKTALKNYIKAYNSVLDSASNTDNVSILRKAAFMTGATAANSKLLDKIGISVASDNKLSLDLADFNDADINDIKTLFQGNNSYASKVYAKAFEISNEAFVSMNRNKLYGVDGKYSLTNQNGMYYNGLY